MTVLVSVVIIRGVVKVVHLSPVVPLLACNSSSVVQQDLRETFSRFFRSPEVVILFMDMQRDGGTHGPTLKVPLLLDES